MTGTAYSSEAAERFKLQTSRYEGPTGITGVLQDAFVRAGIPAVSFWAAIPHYVSNPPNPKATVRCCAASRTSSTSRCHSANSPSSPRNGNRPSPT